jgi:hypothetical protein
MQGQRRKSKRISELLVAALTPVLVELPAAQNGDFPFVVD